MAPFYPYFKLLYKFCQMGMTKKTKESFERKVEKANEDLENYRVQLETFEAYIRNLSFADRIADEVARAQEQDFALLRQKQQTLKGRIDYLK